MPLGPESLDYPGVFRGRKRERPQSDDFELRRRSDTSTSRDDPAPPLNSSSETAATVAATDQKSSSLNRRGHLATFVCLFLFSFILYVRPYEFFPGLSSFTSMAFYCGVITLAIYAFSQLSIEGNLTARPKEINLVLLLGVAALLSMPLAADKGDAWKLFSEQFVKALVIFIVLVNAVRTEWRLRLLLLLVLTVSIYLSVNAINDYRLGLFGTGEFDLVTMIPIAVVLGLGGRNPLKKLIYFGAAGLMVAAVVVTFSRGGFIGLVAAGVMLVRRLGRKNRVATTGALVLTVILFLALAPGAYSGRLSTIFNSGGDLTGSSSQRTEVLKRSVWVALRYPLFGVGIGNFYHHSPRNLVTHNAYTQVASEMGIAAMVIYIMLQVHPIRRLRLIENESYSKPEQARFYYLSIGLQASLVGFMVSSFFGAVAYQWYVYYLVAYAVSLHRLFIIKFPLQGNHEPGFWEHPFAKKKTEVGHQPIPASLPSHS